MKRRIVGPFNRVEGDLEVQLEVSDGIVKSAYVVSPMYRGFEQILQGKDPMDALVYTPRICGICSVAQSMATASAIANAYQITPPHNGQLAQNLTLACENISDHLTHFYLFFMPDFTREDYHKYPWFPQVDERFHAISGTATKEVLPSRAEFMHLMGIMAGKWPHTLAMLPGGSTRAIAAQEKIRLLSIIHQFRSFLENTLFGDSLDNILSIQSQADLQKWLTQQKQQSDFSLFLQIASSLELDKLGTTQSLLMSYGAYPQDRGHLFSQGVYRNGDIEKLNTEIITEDLTSSWMAHRKLKRHPFDGVTQPDPAAENGYSWCKSPRLGQEVVEVGALARQLIHRRPLIVDLFEKTGANVFTRVIARVIEIAAVVDEMENWCRAIAINEPFFIDMPMHDVAKGFGLVEAARGSLGHWIKIKNGRILNYQIIAPTTWNFSPRDHLEVPGILEQALAGTVVGEEPDPIAVNHIVRSFDPCMVCTVH